MVVPTTAFSRFRQEATIYHLGNAVAIPDPEAPPISIPTARNGQVPAICNSAITIRCLQDIYNIDYTPEARNGNQIAVTGFLEQWANIEDFQMFNAEYVPAAAAANSSFNVVYINGEVAGGLSTVL